MLFDHTEKQPLMFEESPFTGACVASTYEVLIMLLGTFVLGLLLGYLIWGWLRRELERQKRDAQFHQSISTKHQHRAVSLETLASRLKDNHERLETKLSVSEYRFRKLQEEHITLRAELNLARAGIQREPPDPPQDDGPTLADISHAMEGESEITESSPEPEGLLIPQALRRGETPDSLEVAADVFGTRVTPNDLKILKGIGPKIEEVLHRTGIMTWADLAQSSLPRLREVLSEAGPRYRAFDPKTWPMQARMAAKGEWRKLKAYQETLGEEGE